MVLTSMTDMETSSSSADNDNSGDYGNNQPPVRAADILDTERSIQVPLATSRTAST